MTEEKNIVETAINAGKELAKIQKVEEGEFQQTRILIPKGMEFKEFETQTEPARKTGTKTFVSVKSFCEYVNKHKAEGESVIIANEETGEVKAILNDHKPDSPGFHDFCAVLMLGFSKKFTTWLGKSFNKNEHKFSQDSFADFIEDNRSDLYIGEVEKDGRKIQTIPTLELKALINDMKFSSEENVISKRDPQTDETFYQYEVKDTGQQGKFKLPESLFIAVPIYKYGDICLMELRLRGSARGGQPKFWYIIDELENWYERAFDLICGRIKSGNLGSETKEDERFDGTSLEVWKGTF